MSMSSVDIIKTGIVMGIIHVLTGPDHLSALATLSGTNISSRKRLDAFLLGIRWGVGHSVGLLVVGGILIAAEETSSEWIAMGDALSLVMESLVGVFMLALGSFGVCQAYQNRRIAADTVPLSKSMNSLTQDDLGIAKPASSSESEKQQLSPESRRASMEIVTQMSEALNRDGDSMRRDGDSMRRGDSFFLRQDDDDFEDRIFDAVESLRRNSDHPSEEEEDSSAGVEDQFMDKLRGSDCGSLSRSFVDILQSKPPPMRASSMINKHATPDNSIVKVLVSDDRPSSIERACGSCSTSAMAVLAGLVHGVAGPGGVLGVIPAVQLRDARLATVYLGTFCLTSTIVMGGFAAFYGRLTEWMAGCGGRNRGGPSSPAARVFYVEIGSAFLSIAVGFVWLVLLSAGKLEEVFQ